MNAAEAPAIGHNKPPEPTLFERADALVANANKWLTERAEISTDEQAASGQLFVDQLRKTRQDLEKAQKAERAPHDTAIGAIKRRYLPAAEKLGVAQTRLQALCNAWLDKLKAKAKAEATERERLAREAEKRAADARRQAAESPQPIEAEMAARDAAREAEELRKAANHGPQRGQIKSEFTSRAMSQRVLWSAEVIDDQKALKFYGKDPSVRLAALQAATRIASALAREVKDESKAPPGFKFVRKESAV